MRQDREQRRAVVTGAAGCLGQALVGVLHRDGWQVHGWDLRALDDPRATWHTVDLSMPDSCAAAAESVPSIDLLVHTAAVGVGAGTREQQLSPEVWQRVIGVNLSGTFYSSIALHKALATAGGLVVMVSSITAHATAAGRTAYSTSKAGIVHLARAGQRLGPGWSTGARCQSRIYRNPDATHRDRGAPIESRPHPRADPHWADSATRGTGRGRGCARSADVPLTQRLHGGARRRLARQRRLLAFVDIPSPVQDSAA